MQPIIWLLICFLAQAVTKTEENCTTSSRSGCLEGHSESTPHTTDIQTALYVLYRAIIFAVIFTIAVIICCCICSSTKSQPEMLDIRTNGQGVNASAASPAAYPGQNDCNNPYVTIDVSPPLHARLFHPPYYVRLDLTYDPDNQSTLNPSDVMDEAPIPTRTSSYVSVPGQCFAAIVDEKQNNTTNTAAKDDGDKQDNVSPGNSEGFNFNSNDTNGNTG